MSSAEWTVVTTSNRRNKARSKGARSKGLCQSSQTKEGACFTINTQDAIKSKGKEEIKNAVMECIESLERQYHSGNGFAFRLLDALAKSSRVSSSANDLKHSINVKEIVAYGIGNFSEELYSAPMLQLAGLLLLRSFAAAALGDCSTSETDKTSVESSFQNDQRRVPIFYFEPCIVPTEKELIESVFCIHVLETNEMGKLSVSDMRQKWDTPSSEHQHGRANYHVLFYMPHCPMRLYCNVIWSHWDHIVPDKSQATNPVIIFGNSFQAYEERTISSDLRKDKTNGVLRLVQFTNERSVYSDADNKNLDDSLKMLERAFNDCNVVSFQIDGIIVVEKPEEYFPSKDPHENGELL